MSSINPASSKSYLSYLNPISLVKSIISLIFSRSVPATPDPFQTDNPVLIPDRFSLLEFDKKGYVRADGLLGYLNESSKHYPTQEIEMPDGSKWNIATTWLKDIERIGEPDQFFLNGVKIEKAPKEYAEKLQVLAMLIEVANGNKQFVRTMTEIWSYRCKMRLMDEITEEFQINWGLNPVVNRDCYKVVVISLNTDEKLLSCHMSGDIKWTLKGDLDLQPADCGFTGSFIYNAKDSEVQITTKFSRTISTQTD